MTDWSNDYEPLPPKASSRRGFQREHVRCGLGWHTDGYSLIRGEPRWKVRRNESFAGFSKEGTKALRRILRLPKGRSARIVAVIDEANEVFGAALPAGLVVFRLARLRRKELAVLNREFLDYALAQHPEPDAAFSGSVEVAPVYAQRRTGKPHLTSGAPIVLTKGRQKVAVIQPILMDIDEVREAIQEILR